MRVLSLDHLVLTVADIPATVAFYEKLGMRRIDFAKGRVGLVFGSQKINLHPVSAPLAPHAARPTKGSADLCFLVDAAPDDLLAHLAAQGIAVEAGPVPRSGASGPIMSVYLRDPDGNLIELSTPACC